MRFLKKWPLMVGLVACISLSAGEGLSTGLPATAVATDTAVVSPPRGGKSHKGGSGAVDTQSSTPTASAVFQPRLNKPKRKPTSRQTGRAAG